MHAYLKELLGKSEDAVAQDLFNLLPAPLVEHLRGLDEQFGTETVAALCRRALSEDMMFWRGKESPENAFFEVLTDPAFCGFYNSETGMLTAYEFQDTRTLMVTVGPVSAEKNGRPVHGPSQFDLCRCWIRLDPDAVGVFGEPSLFGIMDMHEDRAYWYGDALTADGLHPEDRQAHARAVLGLAKTVAEGDARADRAFFLYIKDRLCGYFGRALPETAGMIHALDMQDARAARLFEDFFRADSEQLNPAPNSGTFLPPAPE